MAYKALCELLCELQEGMEQSNLQQIHCKSKAEQHDY